MVAVRSSSEIAWKRLPMPAVPSPSRPRPSGMAQLRVGWRSHARNSSTTGTATAGRRMGSERVKVPAG